MHPSIQPASLHPVQPIPWWEGLHPTVYSELALPDINALSVRAADIVVIGGGVTGLNAALGASEAGASVLVLESDLMPGLGATGRNAGILSAGINMHLADLDLNSSEAAFWSETTRILLSLVEDAARPDAILSAHLTGSISLAESKSAAQKLARECHARVAAGVRAEVWTPTQVTEYTGGRLNTQTVVGALWLPDEGRIQPLTLLAHLARKARAAGVIIAGNAHVLTYQEESHSWKLNLSNGLTVTAQGLIRATGPTTQPNARIYALAFPANFPDDFPLFWDAAPYTYADYRPGEGRLTVSGGRYGKAGVTRHDDRYHQRLAAGARHWLPELQDKEPAYAWAVDLAVTADMVPAIREIGEKLPAVAIEGLGALGVLPGTLLGQRAGKSMARRVGKY